jgi:uncharacterized protein (TIGR02301 family)
MSGSYSRPMCRPAAAIAAMPRIVIVAWLSLGLTVVPASAQFFQFPFGSSPPPPPPPRSQPQPLALPKPPKLLPQTEAQPPEVTTPYDPDLQRLAEILGALHFLRDICGFNEGQKWREEAQSLIEAEAPAGKRHDQLEQSFNRGYLGFQQSYRTCTPAATVAIRRYIEEGARIARDITARYAN